MTIDEEELSELIRCKCLFSGITRSIRNTTNGSGRTKATTSPLLLVLCRKSIIVRHNHFKKNEQEK